MDFYEKKKRGTTTMDEKEAVKPVEDVKETQEAAKEGAASALAEELSGQLKDFASTKEFTKPGQISDGMVSKPIYFEKFPLGEKERAEALKQVATSLDAMVKGDIPHLRKRLEELGVSTKELDEVEKKLTAKVEAAKPVEEAILRGDVKALQKIVGEMKPEQLTEITELIQKHFEQMGMNIEVDFTEGKLILSGSKSDRAVMITKDKLDVIGVNADGSYDFNRHFRRENPAAELTQLGDGALSRLIYPRYNHRELLIPSIQYETYKNTPTPRPSSGGGSISRPN
jgi:hypothetical protein